MPRRKKQNKPYRKLEAGHRDGTISRLVHTAHATPITVVTAHHLHGIESNGTRASGICQRGAKEQMPQKCSFLHSKHSHADLRKPIEIALASTCCCHCKLQEDVLRFMWIALRTEMLDYAHMVHINPNTFFLGKND